MKVKNSEITNGHPNRPGHGGSGMAPDHFAVISLRLVGLAAAVLLLVV